MQSGNEVVGYSSINEEVGYVMELSHFERNEEIRIICDAGRQGLGAFLKQRQNNDDWRPICFASRF